LGNKPPGLGLPAALQGKLSLPMQQGRPLDSDRLELLAVQLESGRVYLIPRTVLENLVRAFPECAVQLIVSASPAGGPLDPLACPRRRTWLIDDITP
jgi:hypothetical protein